MRKPLTILLSACCLTTAVLLAAPVRSNLGGDGEEYGDVEPYTAASYVQEGLFLMYDGIENAGWGIHEDTLTHMQDLGPYNLSFPVSATWTVGDDYLFVPKNYYTPRTINLPDDAYEALYAALSNATITIEFVWEDLGSAYDTGGGAANRGPISMLGSNYEVLGCRVGTFRGNFWNTGYGYYWSPSISISDIELGGSYSATMNGLVTEYQTRGIVRWNDSFAIGNTPYGNQTVEGKWASRCASIYKNRAIVLFPSNSRYTGRLYNLRIYTRALSMEEIAHNWNVDRERFGL